MADLVSQIKGLDNVTYDLQDKVSTFGNENLFAWNIRTDDQEITLNTYQNTGSFTQFSNSLQFDPSKTVGQKYTISFDVISPNGTTDVRLYNSNGNPKYFYFTSVTVATGVGNAWVHCQYTVTNNQNTSSSASTNEAYIRRIEIYAPSKTGVKVKNIKVERGSKATDWTPASKDLAGYISASETIEFFQ